ncbi:MAG: hemolysin III family protein [Lachnospiraceae bacterium]|nr:hemolysin III family protein [Lachnospiraceae bacterium]
MSNTIKRLKDPGSAITHFIAMMMATFAATPLLIKALSKGKDSAICCFIFIISMILLYGASTIYHAFDKGERINKILKKLDHAMIFVLIAGSYTPICLLIIGGKTGISLLTIVWVVGILGIIFKLCWVTCPKWLSSVMYIAMGWLCVLAFSPIVNSMTKEAFLWLVVGGVIYTVGGVLYAIKTPKVKAFNERHKYFGTHEIFHLFVMAGSLCHFVLVYNYVV